MQNKGGLHNAEQHFVYVVLFQSEWFCSDMSSALLSSSTCHCHQSEACLCLVHVCVVVAGRCCCYLIAMHADVL